MPFRAWFYFNRLMGYLAPLLTLGWVLSNLLRLRLGLDPGVTLIVLASVVVLTYLTLGVAALLTALEVLKAKCPFCGRYGLVTDSAEVGPCLE